MFYGHIDMFIHIVYSYFHATMAESGSCDRDQVACKAESIHCSYNIEYVEY